MNRILFETQADRHRLDPKDPRFEHVRGTLRMRVGDSFDAGMVNGPVGKATITTLEAEAMEVSVEWGERPPLPPPLHLLVGMCRPPTVRKILTTAPTLGVRSITFAATGRSDPAYARSKLWTGDEWRARLVEGVEQAFDTYLPPVRPFASLPEAILAIPDNSRCLALDVYEGTAALSKVDLSPSRPVCLAIGPERGWNRNDREELRAAGFDLVSLSERVLRVETAVTVGQTLILASMGAI